MSAGSLRNPFRSIEVRDADRSCRHCKYSLTGLSGGGGLRCPECGNPVSDDDLLGVRRVPSILTAAVFGCGVPLGGVLVCAVFFCVTTIGSNYYEGIMVSGLLAIISVAATVVSILVVTIVYAIRLARASRCLRGFVRRRLGACLLGHALLVSALGIWAWRAMQLIASV